MVPTYIVLVALCIVTSEARIFIGRCSYGFCEQECKQHADDRMECYCRRGQIIKPDGRKCVKSDDTEEDLAASGEETSGQDIEISNCDNEDGDCDSTLIKFPFSGDGKDDKDDGSGTLLPLIPDKEDILPTSILPYGTHLSPDNIPHIISFSFAYPNAKCVAKLDTDPYGFVITIRYQIARSASVDKNSLTDFKVSCGSIDIKLKLVKSRDLSVTNGVKRFRNLVTNGNLDMTIDGQNVEVMRKSFKSVRDPAYRITEKSIEKPVDDPVQIFTTSTDKTMEKPIQKATTSIEKIAEKPIQIVTTSIEKIVVKPIVTTSITKVKTVPSEIDKTHTSMETPHIKSTQTLTKSYPSAGETKILYTDKYLTSTLISTRSMYTKKATQTPASDQILVSIVESKDIVPGFVTLSAPSTTQVKRIVSYGSSAGQTSVRPSLLSLKPVSTSVQEILPLPKSSSTSIHKSPSTSLSSLKSMSTSVQESLPSHKPSLTSGRDLSSFKTSQIKKESESSSKPLEATTLLYDQVPKKTKMTTVVASRSTILVDKTTKTDTGTESTSELISQQPTIVKSEMKTTQLKVIVHSSSTPLVSHVSDGMLVKTKGTPKGTFSTIATTSPLETVVKQVVTTSSTSDLPPKQTSFSKTTLGTSIVGAKTGPDLVSTSRKSSVSDITKSTKIKLDDRTTSSITTSSVISSTPTGKSYTPVAIVSSSFAFKETTKLHKYTIQTSRATVSSETMRSTYKDEIQSSSSKAVTETEAVIKVIVLKKYDPDGKASREYRLLANSYVVLVLTSFIIYLLVLH